MVPARHMAKGLGSGKALRRFGPPRFGLMGATGEVGTWLASLAATATKNVAPSRPCGGTRRWGPRTADDRREGAVAGGACRRPRECEAKTLRLRCARVIDGSRSRIHQPDDRRAVLEP